MAIYSKVQPPSDGAPANTTIATDVSNTNTATSPTVPHAAVDIDAWTISALQSLAVSPAARGIGGVHLSIPIDDTPTPIKTPKPSAATTTTNSTTARVAIAQDDIPTTTTTPPQRPRTPRDSMRRREALLKGNEGSRQRRRYDMARLTDVPNVQPPLASDWEPRPIWTVAHVPYQVAQYWDYGLRERVEARTGRKQQLQQQQQRVVVAVGNRGGHHLVAGMEVGRVPRELRETCKKAPGVKGYVKDLEEPVRRFLVERGVRDEDRFVKVSRCDNNNNNSNSNSEADTETEDSALSSEDEEIVFVGRGGRMRDGKVNRADKEKMTQDNAAASSGGWKKAHRELRDQPVDRGMVYDALDDGESGRFKRWLTHSISMYYGLVSKSVMAGTPARRCVYVGVRDATMSAQMEQLPPPLCELL